MEDQKLKSPDPAFSDAATDNAENERSRERASRRSFIKKALVAGLAITSTGTVASKVSSIVLEKSPHRGYLDDLRQGDLAMMRREYVLMTREEKEALLRTFEENYRKGG